MDTAEILLQPNVDKRKKTQEPRAMIVGAATQPAAAASSSASAPAPAPAPATAPVGPVKIAVDAINLQLLSQTQTNEHQKATSSTQDARMSKLEDTLAAMVQDVEAANTATNKKFQQVENAVTQLTANYEENTRSIAAVANSVAASTEEQKSTLANFLASMGEKMSRNRSRTPPGRAAEAERSSTD